MPEEKLTPAVVWRDGRTAVAGYWRATPAGLVVLIVVTGLASVVPVGAAWLTKVVLDRLAGAGLAQVATLAIWLGVAGLATAVLPLVSRFVAARSSRAVVVTCLRELYTAVNSFGGLARFEDPVFQDRLRLAQGSGTNASAGLVDGVLRLTGGALTAVGFVGSLLVISPTMTGIVVLAAIPALFAQLALSRRRARGMWRIGAAGRREFFYERMLSGTDAAKEVRLFGLGEFLRDRMVDERRRADTERDAQDRREFLVQGALSVLAAIVAGGGLVWAVIRAGRGDSSVGDVSMFVAAVAGVQAALAGLISSFADTHQQLLMYGHYRAVVTAEPDLPVAVTPRGLPALRNAIELRDVWFRYADDQPWILRGVDLTIPHGHSIGVVGHNGAGKSTLVKLLCRFYDPQRGAILWDGVDIRDFAIADLRARLGAVFQDFVSYEMTVADNIGLGDLSAMNDRGRLAAAARTAGVHDTLDALPLGYDTMLSRMFFSNSDRDDPETGVVLSGGQWQRLALARAFVGTDRDLLILDEPSSGLDAEAEHDVHTRLTAHRAGHTSLLISHRLGTLRAADQIVVLSDGRISETGSHDTLMAAKGTYSRLFTIQARGYVGATS
ncbi:MAG TPA: ABC transporter ATP-binding protein [Actinokineospora sp.]|nr:ABC transporter ATP-binding protein [Actinokineospora sp.]